MVKKILPRWLELTKMSTELLENKFLVFKTPLSSRYDSVKGDDVFRVESVFRSMEEKGLKLGLWIDLTYTGKYYDGKEVEDRGCRYVKIPSTDYGQVPDRALVTSFMNICDSFIREFPREVIGVHCTHGCNRSGYFVVSYLVERMNREVAEAVAEFARIRAPGIYKAFIVNELIKRYSKKSVSAGNKNKSDNEKSGGFGNRHRRQSEVSHRKLQNAHQTKVKKK